MFNRRLIGIYIFMLPLVLSSITCFGINLTTPLPQSTPSITPLPPTVTTIQIPTDTPTPNATDTPLVATVTLASTEVQPVIEQVNILEINGFMDEADYWYFYGLVRNDTNRTLYDLQIEVKLLDSSGIEIYSYITNTLVYYLAPGEISPFSDFSTETFPDGKTYQATVVGYNSIEEIDRANLEFQGITRWVDEYDDIYLAGVAYNGNTDPVEINTITGILRDNNGNLVTASHAYPYLNYLEPNTGGPFVMMFDAPIGQAAELSNYTFYTDALFTNPISTQDISLSEELNNYQDNYGDFHLVGSATNNTGKPMNIYLVAGAYDANGNCIDANSSFMPLPINPGEALPYDFSIWGAMDYVPAAYEATTYFTVFIDWISTYEASALAVKLTTEGDTHSFDEGTGIFTGTVINNSGQDLTTAIVYVAIYDQSSGKLIATNYAFIPETLSKDGIATYEVYLYTPNNLDPANIDIIITAFGQ